uniref:Uncharacterized protein n=1 Tax=viral metagenome TaxID=1070528 RepID=A0A6H1ZGV7_9ZZZZ
MREETHPFETERILFVLPKNNIYWGDFEVWGILPNGNVRKLRNLRHYFINWEEWIEYENKTSAKRNRRMRKRYNRGLPYPGNSARA